MTYFRTHVDTISTDKNTYLKKKKEWGGSKFIIQTDGTTLTNTPMTIPHKWNMGYYGGE